MSRMAHRLRRTSEQPHGVAVVREDRIMRFMLLQAYGGVELEGCAPMTEWTPEDVKAHIKIQHTLNAALLERGELVDAQGRACTDQAKGVISDVFGAPRIIDGPYPESKDLLAGYRLVDV